MNDELINEAWYHSVEERFKDLASAFPDGPLKHREYHQAKIDAAREEAEFWKAAKLEMTKAGVSTLLGVFKTILVLAFVGLLFKFGLGGLAATVAGVPGVDK